MTLVDRAIHKCFFCNMGFAENEVDDYYRFEDHKRFKVQVCNNCKYLSKLDPNFVKVREYCE